MAPLVEVLKANLEGLARAAKVVVAGGVICYPTDTVYGLGCDPMSAAAVQRTMEAKGDRMKPMPVLVKDAAAAEKLAYLSNRARKLIRAFWPGPLTLVLQARSILPAILIPEMKVGIRSPKHPVCLNLLGLCGGALVGTSANLTGKAPATTAEQARLEIGEYVDVILDGGRSPIGVASAVVDLTQPKLTILREGPLERKQLLSALRSRQPR